MADPPSDSPKRAATNIRPDQPTLAIVTDGPFRFTRNPLYLAAGGMKLAQPRQKLQASGMGFVEDFSAPSVKLVGAVEVLGALGLILPVITRIAPWLSVAAAIGLVLVQVGAIIVHVRRGETNRLGMNIALLVLASVAVWLAAATLV